MLLHFELDFAAFGGIALIDPCPEIVEDMHARVSEDSKRPANARGAEDSQLSRIVNDDLVILPDPDPLHSLCESRGRGQHVWIFGVVVFYIVEVEEA